MGLSVIKTFYRKFLKGDSLRIYYAVILFSIVIVFLGDGCNTGAPKPNGIEFLSRTDSMIVYSAGRGDGITRLILVGPNGSRKMIPSLFGGKCITPAFSPDGKFLLFAEHDGHDFEIVSYNLVTDELKRITDNDVDDYAPVWAPTMDRIAWGRVPKMKLEYANEAEIIVAKWPTGQEIWATHNKLMNAYPVFLEDGRKLITESGNASGLFGLFLFDTVSDYVTPLLYEPNRSGNGLPHVYDNKVVFESCDVNNPNLLNVSIFDLINRKVIWKTSWRTSANPTPRYSPNGSKIACHRLNSYGRGQIILMDGKEGFENEVIYGENEDYLLLPRWNRKGTLIIGHELNKGDLFVIDTEHHKRGLLGANNIRGQKFLEVYNYDIF